MIRNSQDAIFTPGTNTSTEVAPKIPKKCTEVKIMSIKTEAINEESRPKKTPWNNKGFLT